MEKRQINSKNKCFAADLVKSDKLWLSFVLLFPWKLMFWQLSVSHQGRAVKSSSCSSRWPPLSLNFLFVFWKCRLSSDQWRQRGPLTLRQRLVGDLPRIPEGRVPPSAGIQRLIYWSLYGRWLFLAGGCCCCCWRSLLVSGRMEMRSRQSGTAWPGHFSFVILVSGLVHHRDSCPPLLWGPLSFHLNNFLPESLFVFLPLVLFPFVVRCDF